MREQMKSHRRRVRDAEREAERPTQAPAPADRTLAIPVPVTLGAMPAAGSAPAAPEREERTVDRDARDARDERDERASEAGRPERHAERRALPGSKLQLPTARTTQTLGPQTGPAPAAADPAPVMRMGEAIPGTVQMENVSVDPSAIVSLLQNLAVQSGGGFGENADFAANAGPLIEQAIGANLNPRSVGSSFTETRGANCNWNWRVSFRMLAPVPMPTGHGTGSVQRTGGGSGTVGTQVTDSTTDSAKITGSGTGSSGMSSGSGGGPSSSSGGTVGAELGTSSTHSEQNSTSITTQGTQAGSMTNNLVRYMALLVVDAQVSGELDTSGSDYVNPLKWGMYLGEAIDSMERASGWIFAGNIQFYRSEGIAASAPAMRKGWIEHELGVTDPSESGAARAASAAAVNPAQLSRSGARPLPAELTAEVGQRQQTDLSGVRMIRGGPADTYCDAMSAAAFTTPNPTGGSDIFVHSAVDVASARGQHTLQHEIAHAAQIQKGEAAALNGLGGDASRRQQLERSADEHADAALAATRPERKWTGR